jgi:hypothetical protein
MVHEANTAARQLKLPENLPITEADLADVFVVPYGMSLWGPRFIGTIETSNYVYAVSVDHKLSYVERTHQTEECLKWRD